MKESEGRRLLGALDDALEVLRNNRDSLGVGEVRLQSMLTVLRNELVGRLSSVARPAGTLSESRTA